MIDILEYAQHHNESQIALIFLDAEKAFDNLNWIFMIKVLEKMDFGDAFVKGIEAIFSVQRAKIIVNEELTDNCKIEKGTRQRCPLSPLLFLLVLEVLNREIRADHQIEGVKIKKQIFKLKAFADDLAFFFLQNLLDSIEHLLMKIKEFGQVAGFKTNNQKTKILSKHMTQKQQENF